MKTYTTTTLQASVNWWDNFNMELYLKILEIRNNEILA